MPTVGAAVSAAVKHQFEAAARERCITSSRLAAALITDFLARHAKEHAAGQEAGQDAGPEQVAHAAAAHSTPRGTVKSEQVYVRLTPHYYSELGRLASERQWYRSTYLANLFLAHADRRPVLCEAEINAVREVARQLARLGRSVNQLAREARATAGRPPYGEAELALIKALIELEGNAVKALIRANLTGWGIDDEPA